MNLYNLHDYLEQKCEHNELYLYGAVKENRLTDILYILNHLRIRPDIALPYIIEYANTHGRYMASYYIEKYLHTWRIARAVLTTHSKKAEVLSMESYRTRHRLYSLPYPVVSESYVSDRLSEGAIYWT
jgi:hypothetical protein